MLLLSYFLIVSLSPTACLRAACASISGVLCGLFALTKRSLAYRLLPHVTMLPAGAVVVYHVADVGLTIPSLNSVRVIRTFSLPASFSTNKACFSKPVRAVQMLEKNFQTTRLVESALYTKSPCMYVFDPHSFCSCLEVSWFILILPLGLYRWKEAMLSKAVVEKCFKRKNQTAKPGSGSLGSVCNRACGWLAYTVADYSHTREQIRTSQGCSPKKTSGGTPETRLRQRL